MLVEELSNLCGIDGCIFVHVTGFIGGNKAFEGALAMAKKALEIGDAEICVNVAFKTSACTARNKFDHSQSTTFVNDTRQWSQEIYGDVSGAHGKDAVRIGLNQLSGNCTFGLATNMADTFQNWPSVDGVLGLGIDHDGTIPSDPFLQQLISSQILEPAMFTVYLKHSQINTTTAGYVIYGSAHTSLCETMVDYHNVSSDTPIQVMSIIMGTTLISQTTMMLELVPTILGPRADVQKIADKVGATYMNNRFEISCDAPLPDFEFYIDYRKYTIASDRLIVKTASGCALAINFVQNDSSVIPHWYFGAPLFEQYCVTFDYEGKRLGFARVRDVDTTTLE
ncbi:unnamed protein product [Cylicocyclus nassatus]|uniref:Peptidase A1 domain-containing protein n=1 Tax=Cylicocyclus nassatus TaxID=53992 RepID=A0AA36H0U2_CYLNA|nr:unnamed protein product [Cylicocyclus nassatus]